MNFNKHTYLKDSHAILSPSNYSWLNYDAEKLKNYFINREAKTRGTELHDWAAKTIALKQKQPRSRKTLNLYINDAIGFDMVPEQRLFANSHCHGTADAISFDNNLLRIHDLKTGMSKASMDQLLIYAAIFCIEYRKNPNEIRIELRIYQFDNCEILVPDPAQVIYVIEKIKELDGLLDDLTLGGIYQ